MSERETMEYDVIIVGAGPAGLACAIRLKQLKADLSVAVIEKAAEIGSHILSGAVIEPAPLDELLPGWREQPPPICIPVQHDQLWYLTKKRSPAATNATAAEQPWQFYCFPRRALRLAGATGRSAGC